MSIKRYKTKEEAMTAIKQAANRKHQLIEYLQKGYSAEELEKEGYKMVKFVS